MGLMEILLEEAASSDGVETSCTLDELVLDVLIRLAILSRYKYAAAPASSTMAVIKAVSRILLVTVATVPAPVPLFAVFLIGVPMPIPKPIFATCFIYASRREAIIAAGYVPPVFFSFDNKSITCLSLELNSIHSSSMCNPRALRNLAIPRFWITLILLTSLPTISAVSLRLKSSKNRRMITCR